MKILTYNLSNSEKPFYTNESKKYGFEIQHLDICLDEETMKNIPSETEGLLVCPACKINDEVLKYLKENTKIKYLSTSSAGFDHINIKSANKYGFKIGRIPAYSPTSVASWAFTTGLSISRKTNEMFEKAFHYDFRVTSDLLVKEFKNQIVGIIGTGKIGFETAKYFHSVGFKVLGYDVYPNDKAKEILTYVGLDTLLHQADLVILHIPYIKGENENFINQAFLSKMKYGASLINASRGTLVDEKAVLHMIQENHLHCFATDVFLNEAEIIGHKCSVNELKSKNKTLQELINWYPRILVSQHIAYFTDEAIKNMAQTSMFNFKQLEETGTCDTVIN